MNTDSQREINFLHFHETSASTDLSSWDNAGNAPAWELWKADGQEGGSNSDHLVVGWWLLARVVWAMENIDLGISCR